MSDSAEPIPAFGSSCPGCGYPLDGLAQKGLCPECGLFYVLTPSEPVERPPTHAAILASIGWPAGLIALLIVLSSRLPMEGAMLALVLLLLPYAFAMANAFMLPGAFALRYVPRGRWRGTDVATMFAFSKLAGVLWVLNVLVMLAPLTCCCTGLWRSW